MSDEEFNGEKLMLTKAEVGLILALGLVVGSMFVGIDAFVILGVVLAVIGVVGVTWLASDKPTKLSKD